MVRILLLFFLLILVQPTWAKQFDVVSIQENGSRENRMNLVFLAEGYTSSERNKFLNDVRSLMTEVNSREPFQQYTSFTNIYAIPVDSQESGISTLTKKVHTYFGAYVGHQEVAQFMWVKKKDRVYETMADNFPDYDEVVILVNSPIYGGGGGDFAVISTHHEAVDLFVHELGHTFANLADEYWVSEEYAQENLNMTKHEIVDSLQYGWKDWYGVDSVDIYSFSESNKWHRPHQNCVMRSLGNSYCPVCRQAMIESLQKYIHPSVDFSHELVAQSNGEKSDRIDFNLRTIEPYRFVTQWAFDGVYDTIPSTNYNSATLTASDMSVGLHTLQAKQFNNSYLSPLNENLPHLTHMVSWLMENNGECIEIKEALSSTISVVQQSDLNYRIVVQLADICIVKVTMEDKDGRVLSEQTIRSNSIDTFESFNENSSSGSVLRFWKGAHCFAERKIVQK